MRINGKPGLLAAGLALLTLAGMADAGERSRSHHPASHNNSYEQTRGMHARLHNRGHREHHSDQRRDRHDNYDRHLHYGHERWRHGRNGRSHHSVHGDRGYWQAFHRHNGHDHHGYRHRFYNNYNYYYNASTFYFPGYGHISRVHVHERHCPQWHFNDFAAGFVLGAIILD